MTTANTTDLRTASRRGLILGILTLVLGVLAVGAPLVTGLAVATLVGVLLLIAGATQLAFAFHAGSVGRGVLVFLFGGITVLAGIVVLGRPLVGLASITLILIWYFLADGISSLVTAFQTNHPRGRGWLIFGGVISILCGLLLWQNWPLSGGWAVGVRVGIRLIVSAWTMVMLASVGRAVVKETSAEV